MSTRHWFGARILSFHPTSPPSWAQLQDRSQMDNPPFSFSNKRNELGQYIKFITANKSQWVCVDIFSSCKCSYMKCSACSWNVTVHYLAFQLMTVSKSASIICQQLHFAKQIKVMPIYTRSSGCGQRQLPTSSNSISHYFLNYGIYQNISLPWLNLSLL